MAFAEENLSAQALLKGNMHAEKRSGKMAAPQLPVHTVSSQGSKCQNLRVIRWHPLLNAKNDLCCLALRLYNFDRPPKE